MSDPARPVLIVLLAALLPVHVATAVERRIWTHDEVEAFASGEKENVAVSSTGEVQLAYTQTSILADFAQAVFDLAATPQGVIYVATGNQGKLYRLRDGKTDIARDFTDALVLSLAVDDKGVVYAGTGPSAVIHRLSDAGKFEKLAELPAQYVWAMVLAADGSIIAATGNEGKIFKVHPDGAVDELYDAAQSHVLCLARGADNQIFAGVDEKGIVYRIAPDGSVSVAYDAVEGEIRAMAPSPDGDIYFATADIGASGKDEDKAKAKAGIAQQLLRRMTQAQSAARKGSAVRQPAPRPKVTGVNAVYKLEPSGHVTQIAQFEGKVVLALAVDDQSVYVGTGFEGFVYRIDANLDVVRVAELEEGQITAMRFDGRGRLLTGASNEGRVMILKDRYEAKGTFTSPALDAGHSALWGRVTWSADTPGKTAVKLLTRSGNSEEPDSTWSDWSDPLLDPSGSPVTSPPARLLQYRVVLETEDGAATPMFRRMGIPYLPANLPPRVTAVTVSKASKKKAPAKGKGSSNAPAKKQRAATLSGQVEISWKTEDPNGDDLVFTPAFRGTGETNWKTLESDTESDSFQWNTETVPDGVYEVKVTASDARSNVAAEAKFHERVSAFFVIDNTPPTVARFEVDLPAAGRAAARVVADDGSGRIRSASYSLDAGDWRAVGAADGIVDSAGETFAFDLDDLVPGEHTLTVRVIDDAGNSAASKRIIVAKP